jgi:hypothetical protein
VQHTERRALEHGRSSWSLGGALALTGAGEEPVKIEISPEASRALAQIFDLWPNLGVVTLRTENGEVPFASRKTQCSY